MRLTSDFTQKSVRASVEQTYAQIINDIQKCIPLLPIYSNYITRPTRAAADALMARTFLAMREYDKALLYSDSSLKLYNKLLDFNAIDSTQDYPIPVTTMR